MTRRAFKRRPFSQAIQALSPHALSFSHMPAAQIVRDDAPLLVDGRARVLLGGHRLIEHLRTQPHRTIRAIEIKSLGHAETATFIEFDSTLAPLPSQHAAAVAALHRAGMPLKQIAQCLPGVGDIALASRMLALADSHPSLLRYLDGGQLSVGHSKYLVGLRHEDQGFWAAKCVADGLSVLKLRRALAGQVPVDPNIQHLENRLSEALGARIAISQSTKGAKTAFCISWSTIEELQGLMERLGKAPPYDGRLPCRARSLVIEIDHADEVDALTGHLLGES